VFFFLFIVRGIVAASALRWRDGLFAYLCAAERLDCGMHGGRPVGG
jgi:hypothetical protein